MKTTFKPKNGSTTMQIEAETDNERALLHAVFGSYWWRERRHYYKQKKNYSAPRLRLMREYDKNGKVAKIVVKQVDYISYKKLEAKGWEKVTTSTEQKGILVFKKIDSSYLMGYIDNKFTFYYVHHIGIDLNKTEDIIYLDQYLRDRYEGHMESSVFVKNLITGIICEWGKDNRDFIRKYTVSTMEELGETIKKITAPQ